jgi:murein DD-endopeptidase MepM/ murein hydrolase activator NlpD
VRTPPPLPPWTGEAPSEPVAVAADEGDDATGDEDAAPDRIGGLAIGGRGLLRRLLRFEPTEAMRRTAGGRRFSNLLWPVRGGELADHDRRSVRIAAERGTAVRAAADGLVVYAGRVGRRGDTVVMLHRMGWVTVYSSVHEIHVEPGQRVQRGEWIASTGHSGRGAEDRLDFEVRVDGSRVDPMELLVQVPEN